MGKLMWSHLTKIYLFKSSASLFQRSKCYTTTTLINNVIKCNNTTISALNSTQHIRLVGYIFTYRSTPNISYSTLSQLLIPFKRKFCNMLNYLPYCVSGKIIPGFGRGSKELGIPTANFPLEVVKSLPESFKTGVYYGWANVNDGPVYKMVMSIGWNPYYDNKEKSMETHVLHNFNRDLYDCLLKVCIVGYLRPEKNFKSLDDLINCIHRDIEQAEELLEINNTHKNHIFFQTDNSNVYNGKNCPNTSTNSGT